MPNDENAMPESQSDISVQLREMRELLLRLEGKFTGLEEKFSGLREEAVGTRKELKKINRKFGRRIQDLEDDHDTLRRRLRNAEFGSRSAQRVDILDDLPERASSGEGFTEDEDSKESRFGFLA